MRYRALSADGDYTFGNGVANFHVDTAEAVAQAILTRLRLWRGEWFLDTTEGTPWADDVLGVGAQATRDAAVRDRVLETPGVTAITTYSSQVEGRSFSVRATVETIYGPATVEVVL